MTTTTIAIMNRKGGVGKTTTAVHLAHGLAKRLCKGIEPFEVLLVDLDAQGSLTHYFEQKEVAPGQCGLPEALLGTNPELCIWATGNRARLWYMPSNDTLMETKLQLLSKQFATLLTGKHHTHKDLHDILHKTLSPLHKHFRYIILDCPPSLDFLASAVYHAADIAIVPVKLDYLTSAGTVQHTRNLIAAQTDGFDITIECFLPTFYRQREILSRQTLNSLKNTYGARKIAQPIPQAAAVEQAPAAGNKTLFEYAPKSPAAIAYQKLVTRIATRY